ncbi:MAG: hypothetical protein U0J70_05210, partial [Atopobiaceae bacterium]|nr:hypothetical protein [Atopobiaceae bacterium]
NVDVDVCYGHGHAPCYEFAPKQHSAQGIYDNKNPRLDTCPKRILADWNQVPFGQVKPDATDWSKDPIGRARPDGRLGRAPPFGQAAQTDGRSTVAILKIWCIWGQGLASNAIIRVNAR